MKLNFVYKYVYPFMGILVFGLVVIIALVVLTKNVNENVGTTQNTGTLESFNLADVEKANTISDCLVVYNNNVYRIPSIWADEHPGGSEAIINSCGKDITNLFDTSHTGNTALSQLEEFLVGTIQ